MYPGVCFRRFWVCFRRFWVDLSKKYFFGFENFSMSQLKKKISCIKGCVSCTQEYVLEDFEYVLEDFELIWAKNIFSASKIFLCPNWKFSYVTTEKKIQLKKKSKKKFLLIRFRRCRVDLSTFSKLGRLKSISYKIFGKSTQKWSTLIDFNRPGPPPSLKSRCLNKY